MAESLSPWLKGGSPGSDSEGSALENADLGPGALRSRGPQSLSGTWGCHRMPRAQLCQAAAPPQLETCSRRD